MSKKNIVSQRSLILKNKFFKINSTWLNIKEALAGSEQDFTKIPLKKAVFLLAIPMVLEMVMESVFAVVDIFFVGKLGAEAVAAVGITESLMTILYAIAFGLAMGTTALVSRRIGEKNNIEASKEGLQAIITGSIIAIMIAFPGAIFAKDLLSLMGASDTVLESHSGYTGIMFGGNIVIMLLFINNAIFRGAGDAAIAMRVLWLANGLNIILDPILIFGLGPIPAMGVAGAAVATNIGRGVAVLYQLYILFKGSGRINIGLLKLKADWKKIMHLFNISIGGIGQMLISTSSWVFLVRILSSFGSEVVAAYTIAIRIVIFSILPSWGLSNAASTLVGQNLGAKEPKRAEKAVWSIAAINMVFLGILGLMFIFIPSWFIELFTNDSYLIEVGKTCLKIVAYGFAFYGIGMVMVHAFNGAGDTRTPTKINFIAFWLMEIPLAYLLANKTNLNENGVFYAIIIAESFMTLLALYYFRKGKWKKQVV